MNKNILTEEGKRAVEEAVRKAEAQTSGEIVFAVADASARYHHATIQGALIGMALISAAYLALPISHTITALLWTEFLTFALLYALIPYLPWRRWLIPSQEMDARVHEAAFMQFYSSGLHRTRESNGVEIYLSTFERRVVVIGDRAIHEKMGNPHWDEVRDRIIQGIRQGKPEQSICAAIESCGRALAQHFPHRPDDVNELPNQIIDRKLHPEAP
jgi:putative membrane protein